MYYVDAYRENIRCYGCGATDRCRLIKVFTAERLGDFFASGRRRVLEIGPSHYSRALYPEGADYVSFDLYADFAMVKGDLCAAPFPDAYCDLWVCFHVLDCIKDDERAMRELFRVLRPGGLGLLDNVMNWRGPTQEYGESRADENWHFRRYGTDLPDRLRALGFEVEIADTIELFDEATRARYGIHPRRILMCRRPA